MRITKRDCESAVERLAKITGRHLVIEYSGAPQRPRLAFYAVVNSGPSQHMQFARWVSPRLATSAFYEWIHAAIDGIELFLRDD